MAAGNPLDRLADQYGYGPYAPPVYVPPPNLSQPVYVPPPVATPPAQPAQTVATQTAAAGQADPKKITEAEWWAMIENDPKYKQGLEWLTGDYQRAISRGTEDEAFADRAFQQSLAALSAGGGYTVPAALAEQDALRKEKAAREFANQQEFLREALGSRGMLDSGQLGVEQSELQYGYNTLLKEIDLAAKARQQEADEANARRAQSIAQQTANMQLQREMQKVDAARRREDLQLQFGREKGDLLFKVAEQRKDYYFDAQTGVYRPA